MGREVRFQEVGLESKMRQAIDFAASAQMPVAMWNTTATLFGELFGQMRGSPPAAVLLRPDGRVHSTNFAGASLDPNRAGFGMRSDFDNGVIGQPFEVLTRQLPLDEDARRSLDDQIGRAFGDKAGVQEQSYALAWTEPYRMVARTSRFSSGHSFVLLVFWAEQDAGSGSRSLGEQQLQVMRVQGEERRRIARELHDDTCQQLALIRFSVAAVRKARNHADIDAACGQIEVALNSAQHQIRTLSYVLHPPELGDGGNVEALASFCEGFSRRSGLEVAFEHAVGPLGRQAGLELALYRVVQEALVNAHRHADASRVDVRLKRIGGDIVLEVEDDGVGIAPEIADGAFPEALGVGLKSMRERVVALGGQFCVARRNGTLVRARVPAGAKRA
jgi:signal transduction histidine kinase